MDPKSRSDTGVGDVGVSDYCGNTEQPFGLPSEQQEVGEVNSCAAATVRGLESACSGAIKNHYFLSGLRDMVH
jgi:hypothetical protein